MSEVSRDVGSGTPPYHHGFRRNIDERACTIEVVRLTAW